MATVSTNTHIELRTGKIIDNINEQLGLVVYEAVPFAKTVAPVDTGYLREGIHPLQAGTTHSLVIPANYATVVALDQKAKKSKGDIDSVYTDDIMAFFVDNLKRRGVEFTTNIRSEWEYIRY